MLLSQQILEIFVTANAAVVIVYAVAVAPAFWVDCCMAFCEVLAAI